MVLISIRNTYSYLSKWFNIISRPVQNKIIKETSYQKKLSNYKHKEIYLIQQNKYNQSLEKYYRYPTGLTNIIIKNLKENNVEYQINDERERPPEQIPLDKFYNRLKIIDPSLQERDYQREAIESCLRYKRGIVAHSTASGKSLCLSGVIYSINVKTLVLCIGTDHVTQLSNDIRKLTERKVTIISAGQFNDSGDVVVANVQALNAMINEGTQQYSKQLKFLEEQKKKDWRNFNQQQYENLVNKINEIKKYNIENKYDKLLQQFKCIIHDEVHFCAKDGSYQSVIYHCTNAYYKFGFSGTVYREDGSALEIIAAFGPILSKVDYTYLTNNNYISPARFFFIDPMCDILEDEYDAWPACLHYGIIENEGRNKWIAKIAQIYAKAGKQVLIISPFRKIHGKLLQQLIPNSIYLFGESENYLREQKLREFREKKFMILISSRIFDEVINIPDVRCVMSVGGGKSHNKVYQRIGRGIRKTEGKNYLDVIIPWDSHSRILLKHSKKVKQLIEKIDIWKDKVKFIGKYRKNFEGD